MGLTQHFFHPRLCEPCTSSTAPGDFARFLATVRARLPEAEQAGLKASSDLLLAEVQDEAGHYQGAVDGLPAWERLADSTTAGRTRSGYAPNDPLLASGGLRDSYEAQVHGDHAEVGSHDPVAGYVEAGHDDTGHGRLPPRPIVGGSLFRRVDDVVAALVAPTIKALEGE